MAPFNKLAVRQAFEYAMNKKKMLQLINNRGQIANSILPPAMPGYQKSLNLYPGPNIKKAKVLLKSTGVSHLSVNLIVINQAAQIKLAEAYQAELKQIGVIVNVKPQSLATVLQEIATPNKAAFFELGWFNDYPDPQDFMYNLFDGKEVGVNNPFFLNDPPLNALIHKGDTTLSKSKRLSYYDKAQVLAMKQAVIVPMYYGINDGLVYGLHAKSTQLLHEYLFNPVMVPSLTKFG